MPFLVLRSNMQPFDFISSALAKASHKANKFKTSTAETLIILTIYCYLVVRLPLQKSRKDLLMQ